MPNLTVSVDVDAMMAAANNAAIKASIGVVAIATSGSASDLAAGTVPDARFPAMLPAVDGSQLTNLPGATPSLELQIGSSQILSALPPVGSALVGDELAYVLAFGTNDSKSTITALLSGRLVTVSADYVATGLEKFIQYETLAAPRTVTLLPGTLVGQEIVIMDIVYPTGGASLQNIIVSAGAGIIAGPGVPPASTYSIVTDRGYVRLVGDGGGNFYIIGAA